VTPIAFEVAFAGRGDPGAEPLGRPDPVAVTLPGLRFLLGGRIDRIDRLPDGRYEVVDYKTGRCYRSDYRKTFRNGRLLQHALYTLAAEELLRSGGDPGATVVGGRYDFPSVKGGGQSLRIARPGPSTLASVLGEILGLISGGAFMASAHAKNKEDCKFCDFSPLCGGEVAVTRAAVKLANDRNTALECYRRLQGEDHE
jgi:ATP-dependent helicase/nuclease subunit B